MPQSPLASRRRTIFVAVAAGLALLGIVACHHAAPVTAPAPPAAAASPAHAPHWTYEGGEGPSHWAALSPEFASCGIGRGQSPIDIVTAKAAPLAAGTAGFDQVRLGPTTLQAVKIDIVNNGHTEQVDAPGSGALMIGNERYVLQQFHFHSPSEHTVDGRSYPLEAHFVHKAADGKLAVIGVLFEEGAESAALVPFWKRLPASAGAPVDLGMGGVSVVAFLPTDHDGYRYAGSLTTPPCSEGVQWFVMKDHVTASAAQIAAFRAVVKRDNRPVQPLNDRAVYADSLR
jgi:carbonic anhydrase